MSRQFTSDYDSLVIGGGLVGAAIATGLAASGRRVAVFDGGDRDFRASRGNFGLVWVQGKGADYAPYARWSGIAARAWPAFARSLLDATGVDVGLQQTGGLDFCFDAHEWDARESEMLRVQAHTDGDFEFRMLDNAELREWIPQVSERIPGACFSPRDGHVNPLYLLRALHQRMQELGADYFPSRPVLSVRPSGDGFEVGTGTDRYAADQVVFCAGLANQRLAREAEMEIPLRPLRGQLLITERVAPFLPCASVQVRQTREGTLQIGDSHEDAGFDESTTLDVVTRLAARAVRIFPHLEEVRLQRAWGALRVMTPDGLPVYHRSDRYPGAFAVSCHSGVTLAALHAGAVADWIGGSRPHPLIADFSAARFDVSATRQRRA